MGMKAASVSAFLRREGFNISGAGSSRMREGIRCSNSGAEVLVAVDFDGANEARRMADAIEESLGKRYAIRRAEGGAMIYASERTD